MTNYKIYFKNNNGLLDEVFDGSTFDLNDIQTRIEYYEDQQPELLQHGKYIAVINE